MIMKNFSIALILILTLLFTKCDNLKPDRWYDLVFLKNESNFSISYYCATGFSENYGGSVYPDTLLPKDLPYRTYPIIKSLENRAIITEQCKMEDFFNFPADTLSVFIFHADTINKYTWEEIREGYKILKRYDLSYDDLKRMNWTITYP